MKIFGWILLLCCFAGGAYVISMMYYNPSMRLIWLFPLFIILIATYLVIMGMIQDKHTDYDISQAYEQREYENEHPEVYHEWDTENMTQEQFTQMLNWMMGCNIIDYQDYNDLLMKALPYLR